MSHQTGIKANEKLKKFFAKCHNGKIRLFKVTIENEELTLAAQIESKGTWEDDFRKNINKLLENDQPTYVMCRLDGKSDTGGYRWLLLSWSPDDSPVRQKMLYASTKATLRQEFGGGHIAREAHASALDDLDSVVKEKSPGPLTTEEELAKETRVPITMDTSGACLNSLHMPLVEEAKGGLEKFGSKLVNYLRFSIDLDEEIILLDLCEKIEAKELASKVPENSAKYHLFRFQYELKNESKQALVFVYSMPGYSCPIKERMLYSSSKAPLIESIESTLGAKIDKKMEVDSGKEVSEDCLIEALHPPEPEVAKKFDKPKGPPNRGAKRITKSVRQCSVLN